MPNVNLTINGKDKASGKIKGVTGSIIKAQLAVTAIIGVTKKLAGVTKEIIAKTAEQERVEKALEKALGGVSAELLNQASALQKQSKFGDESIIQGQAFLAQMGATEAQVKRLTPAILDLAEAKGMDLKTAFDLVSKSVFSSTNAMSRYGIEIEGTASSNERLENAVDALNEKFEGQAQVARDTLGGSLQSLSNVYGDLQETLGARFAPAIRTASEGMIGFIDGVTKLIAKPLSETLEEDQVQFNALMSVMNNANSSVEAREMAIKELKSEYSDYLGDLDIEKASLKEIQNVMRKANEVFVEKIVLQSQEEELNKLVVKQKDLLIAKAKQEIEVNKKINQLAKDYGIEVSELTGSWQEQIAVIEKTIKKQTEYTGINSAGIEVYARLNGSMQEYNNISNKLDKQTGKVTDTQMLQKEVLASLGISYDEVGDKAKGSGDKQKKAAEESEATWDEYFTTIGSKAQEIFSVMSDFSSMFFEGQQAALEENLANRLSIIDENTQAELERLGLQDLTKSQSLQKEIAELQASLTKSGSIEDKKRQRDLIAEKKDELAKTKILEDAEKKKIKAKKKAAQEEYKLKVQAFNTQKALDLVSAGSSLALGLVNAAASGAQAGFPAAAVMIPLLTGLVAGIGAVNMALLASKQPPSPPAFQEGVTNFRGGSAIVGEAGPELITAGAGSNVITNENLERMFSSGGGLSLNGPITVVANSPQEFIEQLTELRRYELSEL